VISFSVLVGGLEEGEQVGDGKRVKPLNRFSEAAQQLPLPYLDRSSNKASSGWIVPHIGIQRGESARSTFVHGLRQYHVDLVALWVAAHHAGDFDTGLHHWFASGVVDELSAFFSCFHSRLVDWKRMNK
jgi:hypothetical protein